jgi:DNA primase
LRFGHPIDVDLCSQLVVLEPAVAIAVEVAQALDHARRQLAGAEVAITVEVEAPDQLLAALTIATRAGRIRVNAKTLDRMPAFITSPAETTGTL